MNSVLKVAKEFPDVKFEHATGYKTAPNVANYSARFYEARYLAGKLAGAMTKTNVLGTSLPFRFPKSSKHQCLYAWRSERQSQH